MYICVKDGGGEGGREKERGREKEGRSQRERGGGERGAGGRKVENGARKKKRERQKGRGGEKEGGICGQCVTKLPSAALASSNLLTSSTSLLLTLQLSVSEVPP